MQDMNSHFLQILSYDLTDYDQRNGAHYFVPSCLQNYDVVRRLQDSHLIY